MTTKYPNRWVPGQSGNPNGHGPGRPARTKLTELFVSDLHRSWEQFGGKVLEELAKKQPQAFAQLAARLIPADVSLTIQAQPGNLSPEDWHLMLEILEAVRQAVPGANAKPPGEILRLTLDALRAYTAKTIDSL